MSGGVRYLLLDWWMLSLWFLTRRLLSGLREEIEAVSDPKKLSLLLPIAITSADIESFAAEL